MRTTTDVCAQDRAFLCVQTDAVVRITAGVCAHKNPARSGNKKILYSTETTDRPADRKEHTPPQSGATRRTVRAGLALIKEK